MYDSSIPPATEAPPTKAKSLLISKIDSCVPVQTNNHPSRTIAELVDANQANAPALARVKIKDLTMDQSGDLNKNPNKRR